MTKKLGSTSKAINVHGIVGAITKVSRALDFMLGRQKISAFVLYPQKSGQSNARSRVLYGKPVVLFQLDR